MLSQNQPPASHDGPRELARRIAERWPAAHASEVNPAPDPLPEEPWLTALLSTCFQASLLLDEGRPVTFRLLLRSAIHGAAQRWSPLALLPLAF